MLGAAIVSTLAAFALAPDVTGGLSFAGASLSVSEVNSGAAVSELADRRITSPTPPATGAHAFLYANGPGYARWDPCTPIKFKINSELATPPQEQAAFDAIYEIERQTGLDFAFVGRTNDGYDRTVPDDIDAIIVFGDPVTMPLFGANVLGIGGGTFDPATSRVTTGYVAVNTANLISPAVTATTLQHEIGHLVGLAHVNDPNELMFPQEVGNTGFGPGDEEGLWRLGAAQGCFPPSAFDALRTGPSASDEITVLATTTTAGDAHHHGHHHHGHHHHGDDHHGHHHSEHDHTALVRTRVD